MSGSSVRFVTFCLICPTVTTSVSILRPTTICQLLSRLLSRHFFTTRSSDLVISTKCIMQRHDVHLSSAHKRILTQMRWLTTCTNLLCYLKSMRWLWSSGESKTGVAIVQAEGINEKRDERRLRRRRRRRGRQRKRRKLDLDEWKPTRQIKVNAMNTFIRGNWMLV